MHLIKQQRASVSYSMTIKRQRNNNYDNDIKFAWKNEDDLKEC